MELKLSRDLIEPITILESVVGSTVHGLNVKDGVEDLDLMGVVIEPFTWAVQLDKPFTHYVYRTAEERTGVVGTRSMAGDTDLVVYGLKRYLGLALTGNPTVMLPLFAPTPMLTKCNAMGNHLRALTPHLVSKRAGPAFLGYLNKQRERMMGTRGQKRVKRPELEARDGYDSKYAMHMCRLAFQGIEFMQHGRLTLPMREPERSWLYAMREGKVPKKEMEEQAAGLEADLKQAIELSDLPPTPNEAKVEAFMQDAYREWWKSEFFHTDIMSSMKKE